MKLGFILILFPLVLSKEIPMKKRCVFVDDGLQSKDCGLMYTEEEFAAFLAKQAADVADFAITNPCGLLSCSKKFKRDLDFQYSYASSTVQKRDQRHESPEDQAVN
ncbi:uncharacterized protein PGTG_20988 [Puccinia graminis f. sp. tritici CRL 75-36-700-3]|uniref:Uncharacterized protein n=2 Tax=Puccinia graminis f. sp. tritici TaxID=56615 RepID=H6QQ25_PUCGT|nr:uncharacterized protein PGTG_20988 [Puccinia graminis f. sp. tritici CRL 75-36-700-3]EHS64637.1 hypothetical protein PGTG_20988 [Puccinia graminis f. sp. tritici CRL 75-36-700-3]